MDHAEQPFARAGWRFLFTSDEPYEPKPDDGNPFLKELLVAGTTKVLVILNGLCMNANMPLIPIDASQLAAAAAGELDKGAAAAGNTFTMMTSRTRLNQRFITSTSGVYAISIASLRQYPNCCARFPAAAVMQRSHYLPTLNNWSCSPTTASSSTPSSTSTPW